MSPGGAAGRNHVTSDQRPVRLDLDPAATELARLLAGVADDRLDAPTPCADWTLRDLLLHVDGFTVALSANARKEPPRRQPALGPDWRDTLPGQLAQLAAAWREESAWQGRVSAGGIEMSAEDSALVALEELVVHGWDVARATGQQLRVDDASLAGVERFLEVFGAQIESGQGPYGPAVPVPPTAPTLDRLVGRTGRDPAWPALSR